MVFDADHVVSPDFLLATLPHLLIRKKPAAAPGNNARGAGTAAKSEGWTLEVRMPPALASLPRGLPVIVAGNGKKEKK